MQDLLGKILIYQNEKGDTKLDVFFEGDTIWLSGSFEGWDVFSQLGIERVDRL